MKRFICIYFALFATMSLHARSVLVATLYHTANDSTSVYYGINAFRNAYSASWDGDVITLSSGAFTACDITKEITIRGTGMEADTINHIAPTILLGDFSIYSDTPRSDYGLTMEGIYHDCGITLGRWDRGASCYKPHFIKCRFRSLSSWYNSTYSTLVDACFTQCRVYYISIYGNASFYNCIVNGPGSTSTTSNTANYEFINCVVVASFASVHVNNSIFYNCALYGSTPLDATNVAHHCVGRYSGSTENTNLFSNLSAAMRETNHSFTSDEAIFKTFSGGSNNVTDQETFELQDSIKTKYLGDDGTQVGIYGGPVPFSPKTTLPVVSRFKVASKSDESGKLKVEMQVNTPQ